MCVSFCTQDAHLAGVRVRKCSLEGDQVRQALGSGRYLAIALVDKLKLGLGGCCGAATAAALWGGPDAAAAYLHHGEPAYVGTLLRMCQLQLQLRQLGAPLRCSGRCGACCFLAQNDLSLSAIVHHCRHPEPCVACSAPRAPSLLLPTAVLAILLAVTIFQCTTLGPP